MHDGAGDDNDSAGTTFDRKFGDLVREAREDMQWSQRRLAEVLEEAGLRLDPSAITRIERGTRDVKLREAAVIASVLEINLQQSLNEIALSDAEKFLMGTGAVQNAAMQARKAVAAALNQMDRITEKLDPETEAQFMKGVPRAEFYASLVRNKQFLKDSRYWNFSQSEADHQAKQALVDAIVDGVIWKDGWHIDLLNRLKEAQDDDPET